MLFDRICGVRYNYDHKLIRMLLDAEACMPKTQDEEALIIH